MKRLLPLFLALVVSSVAAPADRATLRERFGQTGDDVWRSALEPEKSNPRVSTFFNYALTLCETGLHPERLEKLFTLAAARQDLDPRSMARISAGSCLWTLQERPRLPRSRDSASAFSA